MAMDKDKLLAYFQAHYLSRQEVLFKLPLNVSIESFWPELLNRRKARAQLLPLYNASGMPYWYVLTDRMIAASERLCEEAISQDTAFDPYRAGMTSAMTEEMFFTSFVEGAQIPLQEAMDFLQRGTEPETIQEQMIWNNRRAWAEMTATLYRPLDGNFVRALAFMLTEEMDDCAEDYRQTDQHPIAAMNNENYEVPPACVLPDRMNEYYDFLQTPDIHPLIKAAVAQAYLLVTRPFPEGNERLSRMMSSAVLLRCGYDFFRDISISSVIARESYRYYKCMCEIIRSENGGDLTYFLQYYLELLVRALDVRNERQRKREQEALEREQEVLRQERKMARKPLTPTVQPCEEDIIDWEAPDDADGIPLPRPPAPAEEELADAEDVVPDVSGAPSVFSQYRIEQPRPFMEPEEFLQEISRLKDSRFPVNRSMPDKVKRMIDARVFRFSVLQWAKMHNMDYKHADNECRYMFAKGWMSRERDDYHFIYSLRIIMPQQGVTEGDSVPRQEILTGYSMPQPQASERKDPTGDENLHTIRDGKEAVAPEQAGRPSDALISDLQVMLSGVLGERGKKSAFVLLSFIERGIYSFTTRAVMEKFKMPHSTCVSTLNTALNLGFLHKEPAREGTAHYLYVINTERATGVRGDGLSHKQKELLTALYQNFKTGEFSVYDGTKVVPYRESALALHIRNFTQRGILTVRKCAACPDLFTFAVTPARNPDFFLSQPTQARPQGVSSSMPAVIPLAAASA